MLASWPPSLDLTLFPQSAQAYCTTLAKHVDHEVEGSHAVIGADLARRFGEKPAIVHAIEAHHNDVEPNSVLDVLVQAADAVSAARPVPARKRSTPTSSVLRSLRKSPTPTRASSVTYAIQAGREVRVMVEPDSCRRSSNHRACPRHRAAHRRRDAVPRSGERLLSSAKAAPSASQSSKKGE